MPGGRAEASHWHHRGRVYHGGPVALCAGTTELTASRAGLRGRLGSRPDLGTQALGEAGPTVARRLVQREHRSCPSRVHAGCRVDACLALVNASHLPSTCQKHRGNTIKTKISPKVVGRARLGLCAFGSGSPALHAHPGRHHLSLKTSHSSLNSHSHAGSSFVQGPHAGRQGCAGCSPCERGSGPRMAGPHPARPVCLSAALTPCVTLPVCS